MNRITTWKSNDTIHGHTTHLHISLLKPGKSETKTTILISQQKNASFIERERDPRQE